MRDEEGVNFMYVTFTRESVIIYLFTICQRWRLGRHISAKKVILIHNYVSTKIRVQVKCR